VPIKISIVLDSSLCFEIFVLFKTMAVEQTRRNDEYLFIFCGKGFTDNSLSTKKGKRK
jgi:hypothetical protein